MGDFKFIWNDDVRPLTPVQRVPQMLDLVQIWTVYIFANQESIGALTTRNLKTMALQFVLQKVINRKATWSDQNTKHRYDCNGMPAFDQYKNKPSSTLSFFVTQNVAHHNTDIHIVLHHICKLVIRLIHRVSKWANNTPPPQRGSCASSITHWRPLCVCDGPV